MEQQSQSAGHGVVLRPQPKNNAGQGHGKEASGEAQGQRACPNCGFEVPHKARICGHCQELLVDRDAPIDEGSFRFARMIVLQEIKHDVLLWLRTCGLVSLATAVIALAVGYFKFHDVIAGIVRSKIDDEVGTQVEAATLQAAEVGKRARSLEGRLTDLDDYRVAQEEGLLRLSHAARESQRTNASMNLNQLVAIRSHVDWTAARLTPSVAVSPPPVFLKQPASILGERAEIVYAAEKEQMRFAWMRARPSSQVRGEYTLQVSLSEDFSAESGVAAFQTPFEILFLTPGEIADQLGLEQLGGLVYWRVLIGEPNESPMVGQFECYANALDRIGRTGEVRVGISAMEAPPFVYRDETSGQVTGFDHELASIIAAKLRVAAEDVVEQGVEVEPRAVFHMYDWLPLLMAPSRNEVDFIVSSITVKPEREPLYGFRFTSEYYTTAQGLVVRRQGAPQLRSLEDLAGLVVAAQKGTTGAQAAQRHAYVAADRSPTAGSPLPGADLDASRPQAFLEASNVHELFEHVLHGRADVAIIDYDIAERYVQDEYDSLEVRRAESLTVSNDFGSPLLSAEDQPEFFDAYGIAVSESQPELHTAVEAILKILEARVIPSLERRYFSPKE